MKAPLILLVFAAFCFSQNLTDNIVIDQFGYREQAKKTAVVRVPQIGSDAPNSYTPGTEFQIVSEASNVVVHSGAPTAFNGGQTDAASGDKIWWFDFSGVVEPGRYYVLDKTNNLRSFSFSIANDVYNNVLAAAIKMFYYQRAGTDKPAQYAGEDWADGLNFSQDAQTMDFFDKSNASKAKDLSGGWFDAGDYNKYTKWTADYIEAMMLAYEETPAAFTDDYNIPESGNGIPDILDEAKWGIAWLLKMQNSDGSVLSVQGLGSNSPPSAVTTTSYYGHASATASFGTAKALAIASRIFNTRGETAYAENLKNAAIKAWDWAVAHPDSIFNNNSSGNNTSGLAAGNQELSDSWDRIENYINAAFSLYEITGADSLLNIFESNLSELPLYAWSNFMDQYRHAQHALYMRYLSNPNGTASVKSDLKTKLETAFAKTGDFLGAYQSDGYRSFIKSYNWGSNKYKSDYGLTFYKWDIVNSGANYKDIAEDYLHYIHGVNPFNMVYLTNMKNCGASKNVSTIYHTWFPEGNQNPAPGYLPGGPNSSYGLDACCPSSCGGNENNNRCNLVVIPNKETEPPAKMYKDINHSWPINTWEITEPSNGYQLSYIRLLSKFVENRGGHLPVKKQNAIQNFKVAQSKNSLQIFGKNKSLQVSVYNPSGKLLVKKQSNSGSLNIDLQSLPNGVYVVQILSGSARENVVIAK